MSVEVLHVTRQQCCRRFRSVRRRRDLARRSDHRAAARGLAGGPAGREASLAYNESISLRLRGPLDVAALSRRGAGPRRRATKRCAPPSAPTASSCCVARLASRWKFRCTICRARPTRKRAASSAVRASGRRTQFRSGARPPVPRRAARARADEHVLVLTAHHIVCDGWSFGVIVKRSRGVLRRSARGAAARAPAPATRSPTTRDASSSTTAASAARRRSVLAVAFRAVDARRWTCRPTGRAAPGAPSPRAAWTYISTPSSSTAARALGRALGASLSRRCSAVRRAAARASPAQTSVAVGHAGSGSIHGRAEAPGRPLRQPAAVAFRYRRRRSRSRTRYRRAQTTLLDAFDHQRYTFGTLLQKLPMQRDPGRLPLVSVMFNVDQALDPSTIDFPGLTFEFARESARGGELRAVRQRRADRGRLRLEVPVQHRPVRRQSRSAAGSTRYETLLQRRPSPTASSRSRAAAGVAARWPRLAALQPAADRVSSATCCMHEFIERQADTTPDAAALVFGGSTLTYARLDARANRIAHALRQLRRRRGVAVGLCVDRGTRHGRVAARHAEGGRRATCRWTRPSRRPPGLHAGDAALGAADHRSRTFRQARASRAIRRCCSTQDGARLAALPADAPRDATPTAATPDTSAYVIYTSGSTGRPKGVEVPHRGGRQLPREHAARAGHRRRDDTLVAVTTLSLRHRGARAAPAADRRRARRARRARAGARRRRAARAAREHAAPP